MKVPNGFLLSPKKVLIVLGVSAGAYLNYEEFLADSIHGTPIPRAHAPVASESPTPSAPRSPLAWLEESAKLGNVKDQMTLALKYSKGDGVTRSAAEASRWYLMAANGGNVEAMYEVSLRYTHGYGLPKNTRDANAWRQRAAVAGHADAAYATAQVYGAVTDRGAVLAEDRAHDRGDSSRQLVSWLTRASELGSAKAKHQLALVRLYGISADRADKTGYLVPLPALVASGVHLLTENGEAGYWESQLALAELYETGFADVKPNAAESNKWWQRLEAQSDAPVQLALGLRYRASDPEKYHAGTNKWKGENLSYDDTNRLAFEWFGRAAAQGNIDALWHVAVMEHKGIGTTKNPTRALQLHRKAAERGQAEAIYALGIAYANGDGVEQDYTSALMWLARAAAFEDPHGNNPVRAQAQEAIGGMYESGYGVNTDVVLAYAWHKAASVAGSENGASNAIRLAQQLNPDQLVEGETLARAWTPGAQITRRAK